MSILITGANGFLGRNLRSYLSQHVNDEILEFDIGSDCLHNYVSKSDFIFHLAGVNRPEHHEEFFEGNTNFTKQLIEEVRRCGKKTPIVYSSTIHATSDTPYGKSKRNAEQLLFDAEKESGIPVFVYRLPNVFGKWCRPQYNSAIATFCHNIARDIPITVVNAESVLRVVYIDDVIHEFYLAMQGNANKAGKYCAIATEYCKTLGYISNALYSFRNCRAQHTVPDLSDDFVSKLYSTYLSHLPTEDLPYQLDSHFDSRGSFTEFIRTPDRGQISVNISRPGIIKGNHWHHSKNEKFLVVAGQGIIRLRKIYSETILEYPVSSETLQVVEIPPGYVHNIENTGTDNMVTIMWVNECFNLDKPDTWYMEV